MGVCAPGAEVRTFYLLPKLIKINHVSRFLYFLFLSVDACFRLKRRLVSNEEKDPGLATGATYFVPDGPFREFLKQVTDQLDVRIFHAFK